MQHRQVTYRPDERARQRDKDKLLTYLKKGGDPAALPPALHRIFEPADADGFYALRETPLQKKLPFAKDPPLVERTMPQSRDSACFTNVRQMESEGTLDRLLRHICGQDIVFGGVVQIKPEDALVAKDVIRAFMELHPGKRIIVDKERDRHTDHFNTYGLTVMAQRRDNFIETRIFLSIYSVIFPMEHSSRSIPYGSFEHDARERLQMELAARRSGS